MAASSKILLASGVLSNAGIGETIRRTMCDLYIKSDQAATSENYQGAFGIVVVSDLALAAGASAIPGPVTDRNDDGWLLWKGFQNSFIFSSAVGIQTIGGLHVNVESRGMRRIDEGFAVAFMVENTDATTAFQFSFSASQYATRN